MNPLVDATLITIVSILGLAIASYLGVVLGRFLSALVLPRGRTTQRSSDTIRAERVTTDAYQALQMARDIRIAAESLENHLKGAAHV